MVMPFNDSSAEQSFTKIIRPLCSQFGLDVIRADEISSNQVIYDDIVKGIQEATIVIVDISGKNANVMYELGMAHAFKQSSTVMLTHDVVTESPFDIKHFRIIPYKDSIEGSDKLKQELSKTIEVLLNNHRIASKNEFEFCIEFYRSMNKSGDLIGFLGLAKRDMTGSIYTGASWEGRDEKNGMLAASVMSLEVFFRPFESLSLVRIKHDIVDFTEKGKVFAEILEEKGYVCERIDIGARAAFHPFSFMNPIPPQKSDDSEIDGVPNQA